MRRGPLACVLWPISLLFRALVVVRRWLYGAGLLHVNRLPVPVIVVGNIFIGGTGKTPLAIWLVDALRQAGYSPGVVSRGHGASNDTPLEVTPDSEPQRVGDEPVLIACRTRCPVIVGHDRAAAARVLLSSHPEVDVIVSDDGLQHYALGRDLEIVLFDARGCGNGWMLPAGPLREPAARRRDFTVFNEQISSPRASDGAIHMRLEGALAEHLSDRSQRIALYALSASAGPGGLPTILAAAGIGNPARFFSTLRDAGLVFAEMPLPDHYDFAANPFADAAADIILITEKDAVKCSRISDLKNDPRLWVVPVTARIEGLLAEKIVEKLRGYTTA
jgi:tetraacyldisaccharide 4'-kinase